MDSWVKQVVDHNILLLIVWLRYEKFKESQLQGRLFFVDFMKAFGIVPKCRHRGVGHAKRVYRYITKAKDMLNDKLPKHPPNIALKVQKTNNNKILSSSEMHDIMKRSKRWGVVDLSELYGDAMKDVIVEDQ